MNDNKITGRGDFRGDFTRDTFDPMRHFSRVLMQQGRVQLDADWNEQVSILLHYMRLMGRDLMGPHGAPYPDDNTTTANLKKLFKNFKIRSAETPDQPNFSIAPGRYYVNGICCENKELESGEGVTSVTYRTQTNYPFTDHDELLNDKTYLVYLDVWERHLTCVEDDYMREKALGGADTASRAQIVWQVKVIQADELNKKEDNASFDINSFKSNYSDFLNALPFFREDNQKPKLKARAKTKKASEDNNDPCKTAPEESYRGAENQLYRVEIHNGGTTGTDEITFKWSRENGSVIFPIDEISGSKIKLEHLGRDDRFGLQEGDWVEVLDDDVVLRNVANPLLKVVEVEQEERQVTLLLNDSTADTNNLLAKIGINIKDKKDKHPYLRRWDQTSGNKNGIAITWKENEQKVGESVPRWIPETDFITLEHGVQVSLLKYAPEDTSGTTELQYYTGDYWLIPARTETGDVEWPSMTEKSTDQKKNKKVVPKALPPQGVEHHYAPLAIIEVDADGKVKADPKPLRRQLTQGW